MVWRTAWAYLFLTTWIFDTVCIGQELRPVCASIVTPTYQRCFLTACFASDDTTDDFDCDGIERCCRAPVIEPRINVPRPQPLIVIATTSSSTTTTTVATTTVPSTDTTPITTTPTSTETTATTETTTPTTTTSPITTSTTASTTTSSTTTPTTTTTTTTPTTTTTTTTPTTTTTTTTPTTTTTTTTPTTTTTTTTPTTTTTSTTTSTTTTTTTTPTTTTTTTTTTTPVRPSYELLCGICRNGGCDFGESDCFSDELQGLCPTEFTYCTEIGCTPFMVPSNTITSPVDFMNPPNYRNYQLCKFIISAPVGQRVQVTYTSYDLEDSTGCTKDYTRAYDGSDIASTVRRTSCGTATPEPITSTGTDMVLVFQANSAVTASGFAAQIAYIV